jgi:hypothetical protein
LSASSLKYSLVFFLEPLGQDGFSYFAAEGLLVREVSRLHELLGDGRTALHRRACVHVCQSSPYHRFDVDAAMVPKAVVLGVEDRVDEDGPDLVQAHGLAVEGGTQGRHYRAVCRIDHRRDCRTGHQIWQPQLPCRRDILSEAVTGIPDRNKSRRHKGPRCCQDRDEAHDIARKTYHC